MLAPQGLQLGPGAGEGGHHRGARLARIGRDRRRGDPVTRAARKVKLRAPTVAGPAGRFEAEVPGEAVVPGIGDAGGGERLDDVAAVESRGVGKQADPLTLG